MHLCLCVGRQQPAQEGCGLLCLLLLNVSLFPLNLSLENSVSIWELPVSECRPDPFCSNLASSQLEVQEAGSPGGLLLKALLAYIF